MRTAVNVRAGQERRTTRSAAIGALAFSVALAASSGDAAFPDSLVNAGHFKRAGAILPGLMQSQPRNAHLQYLWAICRLAFGDTATAMKSARTAADLDPGNATYRSLIAEILSGQSEQASGLASLSLARSAKSEAEAAVRLDSRNLDALNMLMMYLAKAPGIAGGDKEQARKLAEQIAQIDPVKGDIAQARILPPKKQAAQVEAFYRKALGANPKSYDAEVGLAQNLWQQGKFGEAVSECRRAIPLQPDRIEAYVTLARAQVDSGQLADLDPTLAAAEKAVPDDLSPYFIAGRRLLAGGAEPDRAQRYLRKFLTTEPEGNGPTSAMGHWQLGLALEKLGRRPEAVSELETAVRLDENLEEARRDLKRVKQ
jgi:tetratricopeptide (TPR) repeat protein